MDGKIIFESINFGISEFEWEFKHLTTVIGNQIENKTTVKNGVYYMLYEDGLFYHNETNSLETFTAEWGVQIEIKPMEANIFTEVPY